MKKIIILSIVFVISFLVFSVIKLPAAVALNFAKPYLPAQLEVGQTFGTLWQGQIMQLRFQGEQLNNVRWDISGWSIFKAQVNTNLRFGNPRERDDISGYADISYS
ncbi:MAG: type II secretion system protein N, partial [Pseudomonadota bacterium]